VGKLVYGEQNGKDKSARKLDKVAVRSDAPFRGYINVQLTPEEKLAWLSWSATSEVWDALSSQVSRGINCSVKLDPKGSNALASATQRDPASVNAGLCVTARGADAGVALSRVIFILGILDREESWEATQPIADPDRW
jgi:hypothetical protein